tara:strand:+ start:415 stop:1248 length:834 start_codon:yes stop_codon:yes gene_type:complete
MHLLCNAYWLDTSTLQGCDLLKIKEPTYGFNQNAAVVATLSPSPRDNFCASAKHNDSPNTFSIDSAALISPTGDCGKAEAAAPAEKVEAEAQIKAEEEEAECFVKRGARTLKCTSLERAHYGKRCPFQGYEKTCFRFDISGCATAELRKQWDAGDKKDNFSEWYAWHIADSDTRGPKVCHIDEYLATVLNIKWEGKGTWNDDLIASHGPPHPYTWEDLGGVTVWQRQYDCMTWHRDYGGKEMYRPSFDYGDGRGHVPGCYDIEKKNIALEDIKPSIQ